ncbi:MAG: AMP-binding protein, partial [Alphaproteobacteria bacterium]
MNLCDVFAYHARKQPDVAALIDGERTISFGELDELIGRTAAHLIGIGLRPGERVGCALKEGADHIVLMLGIMRAGLVYVPLDWRAPPAERGRLAARMLISMAFVPDGTPALSVATEFVNADWHGAVAQMTWEHGGSDGNDAPAMISLSSGTTGEPGAVVQTHHGIFMQNTSRWHSVEHLGPRRYFSALPLYFTAGRQLILDHIVHGATAIVYPALFSPDEFVEQVKRYQATVTM